MSILSQVSSHDNHDGSAVEPLRRLGIYESIATPPIQLVKNAIFAQAAIGDTIAPGVRLLAAQSGVSRGMISDCLYQLDRDGWIAYDGRMITLVRDPDADPESDRSIDRSHDSEVIDRSIDQDLPDRPIPHQDAPQSAPNRDRVKTACMVLHESKIQEEESARDPLFDRLTAEPRMNVPLARRIASHPPGDVADFDADLKIAETFADYPFWFAVDRWKNGQRVLPPEEQHHERPARSDVPAYQRGRSARRAGGSHNPTGGAELRDPGWAQRAIAAAEAEGLAQGYANG